MIYSRTKTKFSNLLRFPSFLKLDYSKSYRRKHGTAPYKKDTTAVEFVRCLLFAIPQDDSPKHIRDRAIIALGFAWAFRRSELYASVENFKWTFRDN